MERLAAFFGGRDVRDLRASDARRFVSETLQEGRSGDLVANALSILRRVLNLAVEDGILEAHPLPQIGKLIAEVRHRTGAEVSRPDAWTRDEARKLLEVARVRAPALWPALAFAFGTGARRGEILALRWEDLELPAGGGQGRVHVRRTGQPSGSTKIPKGRRDRFTPLGPGLVGLLLGHRQRLERARLQGRPPPPWVFPSPEGKRWIERNFSRSWERVREKAGKAGVRPLPFHAARHSFVSWALEDGQNAKRVAEWAGMGVEVLLRVYAHVLPAREDVSFADLSVEDSA